MDNLKGFIKFVLQIFIPLIIFGLIVQGIQNSIDIPKLGSDIVSIIVIIGIWAVTSVWPIISWGIIIAGIFLFLRLLLTSAITEAINRSR
jgi:Na+/H+-dicarboxylate symporter